jgi:hypothetical protein
MATVIERTLNPNWYHGHTKKPPFFEGWYYKIVSADRTRRYAVIPGIFLSDDPNTQHAFVQVFDGVSGRATYHRYPADQFSARRDAFDVRIGSNHFNSDGFTLDIADELRAVRAEVQFHGQVPYPVSIASPGIMGPFAWLPFMECYHGIVSLDHGVTGMFDDDGVTADFNGGRGYIEKDWGKSFPAGWVWMQTNHFSTLGSCLTASVAVTPMLGSWFPGFIAAIWHEGELYRFTTYTGATVEKLDISDDHVMWSLKGGKHRLEIYATRADASLLPGPDRVAMEKRVPETLKASIQVCMSRLAGGKPILDSTGDCAGLEVAGDIARLLQAVNKTR